MEAESSIAQTNKYKVTWQEIYSRINNLSKKVKYYGIPRGGQIIAGLTGRAVDSVDQADVMIDDINDSGKTKAKFTAMYPDKKYMCLFDKQKELKDKWIIFPWEKEDNGIEDIITRQIQFIGDDPNREGLVDTPKRVIKSWEKLYGGYRKDPNELIRTFKKESYDEMILLKDIEFYSTCEHHLLPFYGKAHIAYIPRKKIIGISKLARLLEIYSRRLQIQERIGEQVTKFLMTALSARGASCIIEAQHFCMTSRGVEKQNSKMITSSLKGVFIRNEARHELLNLIKG